MNVLSMLKTFPVCRKNFFDGLMRNPPPYGGGFRAVMPYFSVQRRNTPPDDIRHGALVVEGQNHTTEGIPFPPALFSRDDRW